MKVEILEMERKDVEFCAEQAKREGWNPGLHDMDVFHATDPHGWFKAVDGGGKIIGGISAVAYDATFGFVGFFVVLPEHRGGRVGVELALHALDYLGERGIGQDGVFAKVENYETWGFDLAYRNLRYEWVGGKRPEATGMDVKPYSSAMLAEIVKFDEGVFPCRREEFLKRWLAMPESVARTAWAEGGLSGWGMRRRCVTGHKIGPLFAKDAATARALLRELLEGVASKDPVYLDVPEINEDGVALAEALGMKQCFGTARMYRNGTPELDVSRIFGVTSFELG